VNTVYSWVSTRKILYHKIGRLPKFDIQDVERWLDERKIAPAE
jgi:excisionase family DNA binding protein